MIVTEICKTPEAIVAACLKAKALAPVDVPPNLPADAAICNVPAWYGFESAAWGIGETLRQSFSASSKLKKDNGAVQAVLAVIQYRNLRRGRESFVMALGFTAAAAHAGVLAGLIGDSDIDGHIVSTLLKMRAPGYPAQVARLANHKQIWVRRLVRRYIERYGEPSNNSFKPNPLRGFKAPSGFSGGSA
jgi:hypothetical protein